ncbi:MAG: S24/S26 family peptidase [Oscillospiraceae bacterium]|nr:S24/S26 family peptidase [Oscillospiraceae bacterium]
METREIFTQLDNLMPLFRERLEAGQRVKFSPRGTSMLPMLRQGVDTVTLSPLPEKLQKYDLPLYRRKDGKYVLHRIVETGDTYTCIGDNQFVYEYGLTHEQMIAVVSSFTRGNREYRVGHFGYRLYCRLWHYSRKPRHFCRRALGWLCRRLKR